MGFNLKFVQGKLTVTRKSKITNATNTKSYSTLKKMILDDIPSIALIGRGRELK